MSTAALKRAIEKVGSQTALADRLTEITGTRVRQQNVWSWLNRTQTVPAEFAIPVEQACDGVVSRSELRPDIYPEQAA